MFITIGTILEIPRRSREGIQMDEGGAPLNLGDVLDGACKVTKNKILPPLSSRSLRQASTAWVHEIRSNNHLVIPGVAHVCIPTLELNCPMSNKQSTLLEHPAPRRLFVSEKC
jgi:hypothetical protein